MLQKYWLNGFIFSILFHYSQARCNNTIVNQKVYFDVSIGDEYWGRIVIGLFGDTTPITALNFATFASNHNNKGYRGTIFNRVYPSVAIQGGDVVNNNGTGSTSIFNEGEEFADEDFYLPNYRGFLAMANRGPNTNGCQFFVNLAQNDFLNNNYVVFAKVLSGLDVVDKIAGLPLDANGVPTIQATVIASGTFYPVEPFEVPFWTYF